MVLTSKAEKLKCSKTVLKQKAVPDLDLPTLAPDLPDQEVDDPVQDVQDPTQDQLPVQGPDPDQDRHPGQDPVPEIVPEIRMVMVIGDRRQEVDQDPLIKMQQKKTALIIEWMSLMVKTTK